MFDDVVTVHGQVLTVAESVHDAQVCAVPASVQVIVPLVAADVAVIVTEAAAS